MQPEGASAEVIGVDMGFKHNLWPVIRKFSLLHSLEFMRGWRDVLAEWSMKRVDEYSLFTSGNHHTFVT
jgi:hypothetical protein